MNLLTVLLVALWLFLGAFFHSAWVMIWGDAVLSQTVFVLLWASAFLSFVEPPTMEHDS